MRVLPALLILVLALVLATHQPGAEASTCYGRTPCNACKNCHYCKHCHVLGGTCGVCRPR
jgi:hypothetical protein